jgi:uncharacterized protein (UPF0332 family)
MPDSATRIDLAMFRLERAAECLRDAEDAVARNSFRNAANRSYYCIFDSIRTVFAFDGFDSNKHETIISKFNEKYIKSKIFPEECSKIIGSARKTRNKSDYDDFYIVSKNTVSVQVENAKIFWETVKAYAMNRIRQEHERETQEQNPKI